MLVQAIAWATPYAPISEGRGRATSLDERWPNSPIRLCAIRVEFQEDDLTGTTGNGTFGTGFPDSLLIDPLPHDRQYFVDHLSFLDHYFSTASNGELDFQRADVYPSGDNAAYLLAYPMWHYNFNSDTALLNQRLVELFAQSVTLADTDVDFSQYDAVIVFHAGVGKDFNVGIDNTPFDIPSAYISESDLNRYGGQLPFGVTRGLLLPEAQNQPETLDLGVELSLNGVLIKLFGNWLGMPDLFNTETGASGIGRWGMMDQGSGNVNALVPALPDAWSRVFMGWSDARTIYQAGNADTVRLGRVGMESETQIVKVAVSADEYYLLENRDADADSIGHVSLFDRDGREMQIDRDGDIAVEQGFKVAVRASHYDFGIPGSGILIWHINEKIIAEKYESNRVNADAENRGVDLVECDGSQDIGREYGFATSGSGTELGIQEDCWYRDNRAYREANGGTVFTRFNDDSRPSARLSDHSYTFLAITDFSDVDSVMTCRVRGTLVEPGYPASVSDTNAKAVMADLDGNGVRELYLQSHDTLFVAKDSTGLQFFTGIPAGSVLSPVIASNGDLAELLLLVGNPVGLIRLTNDAIDTLFRIVDLPDAVFDHVFYCKTREGATRYVYNGLADFQPLFVPCRALFDGEMNQTFAALSGPSDGFGDMTNIELAPSTALLGRVWMDSLGYFEVGDSLIERWTVNIGNTGYPPTVIIEPNRSLIYVSDFGYLDAETGERICNSVDCLPPQVDWDGDGRMDGGGADGANSTPREDFSLPTSGEIEVHDLNFNGEPDLLQITDRPSGDGSSSNWQLTAYDHDTHRYADFPLALTGRPQLIRILKQQSRYHVLTRSIADGVARFTVMRLPLTANGSVEEIYQAPENIIVIGAPRPQVHARDEFAYVWPNPAVETAHIRLTLPYAADADVTIYDLAGRRVATLSGSSSYAGPFELDWQTSSVQSGVYIGKVEVRGNGQTQTAELKIAVVR
ncbi:MAG: T9SS type A sorting domain-containing protein [bacterium]|nr:T9SS type A sorting domain-containing protein [bacterium]